MRYRGRARARCLGVDLQDDRGHLASVLGIELALAELGREDIRYVELAPHLVHAARNRALYVDADAEDMSSPSGPYPAAASLSVSSCFGVHTFRQSTSSARASQPNRDSKCPPCRHLGQHSTPALLSVRNTSVFSRKRVVATASVAPGFRLSRVRRRGACRGSHRQGAA